METVIFFLLKAVASGTVGHYLKRGLENIDAGLRKMFEEEKPASEISMYIEQKDLGGEVDRLANSLLGSSIFIPIDRSQLQSLDARVEFFKAFLETGYLLSRLWKADILLPGSLLGANSITLFRGDETSDITLPRVGVKLEIPQVDHFESLVMIPLKNEKELNNLWDRYKQAFADARSGSNDYSKIETLSPDLCDTLTLKNKARIFRVQTITAGAVMYAAPSLAQELAGKALTLEGEKARVDGWQVGTTRMLKGIQELHHLLFIPATEVAAIRQLSEQLKSLLDNVA